MNPKSLPKKYEKTWGTWPTLDELRAVNPEFKQHQVRALLRPVLCFRCPDSSVRYLPDGVSEALLNLPGDESEATGDDALDAAVDIPKAYDVLMLMRECMRMLGDSRKHGNDTVKALGDTVKAMEKPMQMGLDLVERATAVMAARLTHYDEIWDRMMRTTEGLITDQGEREIMKLREQGKQELRQQTLGLAAGYIPTIIQGLNGKAAPVVVVDPKAELALKAFLSLEPEMVDTWLNDPEILEPHQREHFAKLRAVLAKEQPPAADTAQKTQNHSAPS